MTAVGRFLNKGNQKFAEFSRTKYFIDKTELLNVLLEKDVDEKFICCSRPRRFGKSVTADMMTAYFSRGVDSRSMDEDSTAGLVQQVHSDFISSIEYNDENSLVCTITVALLAFFRYYHRPMRGFPRGKPFGQRVCGYRLSAACQMPEQTCRRCGTQMEPGHPDSDHTDQRARVPRIPAGLFR